MKNRNEPLPSSNFCNASDSDAATLRERKSGTRGLTRGIERGVDRWPTPLDSLIRLARDQLLDPNRQSARRGERNDIAVNQTGLSQTGLHARCERELEATQCRRRQLLGS